MFEFQKIPQINNFLENGDAYIEGPLLGSCCKLDGSGGFTANLGKVDCFNRGGYWVSTGTETTCPKQIKKNCCSRPGGIVTLTTNITECGCSKLPGNPQWVESSVTSAAECPESANLVSGGACCYWDYDGSNYINKCTTADNEQACEALNDGISEGLQYNFYPGQQCAISGGDILCSGTRRWTREEKEQLGSNCIQDTEYECNQEQNILGNCCTQLESGNLLCSVTTKSKCSGFWSYFGSVTPCNTGSLCSGVYFQTIQNNRSYPPTASYTTISTSTNTLEALPSIGSLYQGGVYAGIFEPGVSTVYGNKNTGKAQTYRSYRTGYGGQERRWIIIVAPQDTETYRFSMGSDSTSNYDGFHNLLKLDIPNITGININGFTDWYIPSKQELEFIFNNLSYNYAIDGFSTMNKEYYLTSSFYNVSSTSLGNNKLVYAQINLKEKYGNVFLAPEQTITQNIRLIRRIYLST